MKGLTERQKQVVDFIARFIQEKRYAPSYREIGSHFNFASTASVYKHIQTLKRKGVVLQEASSRTLAVAEQPKAVSLSNQESVEISLVGSIVAGKSIQMYSRSQKIAVPKTSIRFAEKTYGLRISGSFLNEELMADGDLLLVEVRTEVQAGETVLAMIKGEGVVVRKYFREGETIHLKSANVQNDPIISREDELSVHGVVIGLIRFF